MGVIDRFLRAAQAGDSLRRRLRSAQMVLVVLMLIPALVSIGLMTLYSRQYHSVVDHMERVSSLIPTIRDDLHAELADIVYGRTRFDEGRQFALLEGVDAQLGSLIDSGAASRLELSVARNALSTLALWVRSLGEQMAAGSTVDEDMAVREETNNVAVLVVETLQNAINAEIEAGARASDRIQQVISLSLAMECGLLGLTLVFAVLAQRSMSRAIREPIDRLERFAGRIAGGELSERVPQPDVEELQDLTQSLNTMAFKLQRLIEENKREQENLKKSELRALQAQITPHFLYNTLDAIVWLAEARRTGEVVAITRALSDFFRTSLNNGKDWITVEQEAEHLEGYLTIQKIRYRDILSYSVEIDPALAGGQVLKLVIQPLVENAIYHGIKNRRGGGLVTVKARADEGFMDVTVTDNGVGMGRERLEAVRAMLASAEPPDTDAAGYGLYSVDKRLKLCYGQTEGLLVDSEPGEGTAVRFRVPVRGTYDG